jgi:recombination protein RecR
MDTDFSSKIEQLDFLDNAIIMIFFKKSSERFKSKIIFLKESFRDEKGQVAFCHLLTCGIISLEYGMSLLSDLIEKLQWLPGVGRKTAQRLAFYMQKMDRSKVQELTDAIIRARTKLKECSICNNLSEEDPCEICRNATREKDRVCVVEQPSDVMVIEKTSEYRGQYHVIHGVISPIDNVGPDDLRIDALVKRIESQEITEVILATNPTTEGDVTALYIAKLLKPLGVKVTRIARGLPMGSDLDLADTTTLTRALEGRREL